MHTLSSSFVFGYHGCDLSVAEDLLRGSQFTLSEIEYDWLGSGAYFWEANPLRALEFAKEQEQRNSSKVRNAAVVGAVIDLGLCLDLISSNGISAVAAAYNVLKLQFARAGAELPRNRGGSDMLLRPLDCAVINLLHATQKATGERPFDTVRGVFLEGDPVYENSGFRQKTHIQICVRNIDGIKAVFRIPPSQLVPR